MNIFNNRFLLKFSKKLVSYNAENIKDVNEEKLVHLFLTEGVSYVPVIKKGEIVLGVISRKKYFFSKLKNEVFNVGKITKPPVIVNLDDDLAFTLSKLKNNSSLILLINGIPERYISSKVVLDAFEDYSKKFMIIEKSEKLIRNYINENCSDYIEILEEKNQHKINGKIKTIEDLFFSDYTLIFSKKWDTLTIKDVSNKNKFMRDLTETNRIRNGLFHFRKNEDLDKLGWKPIEDIISVLE